MKQILLISLLSLSVLVSANSIYMWEYSKSGSHSCCLHLSGNDICNPNVACTRNLWADLMGIQEYIARLQNMEKSGAMVYATLLHQADYYIRHVLYGGILLSYHTGEARDVKFLHEIAIEAIKSDGKKQSSSQQQGSDTKKQTAEDIVFQHLVKLGLARPHKKK